MITFNQLKYNTFVYTMSQVPCIRLILLFIFLTVSSVLYYVSIEMHESTIFNISGRVDFLNMPILDRIENKTSEWWNKEIPSLAASQNTVRKIMKEHYLQQKPVIIKNYADFIGLRDGFASDADIQNNFINQEIFFQYHNYHKFRQGSVMKKYDYFRNHSDSIPMSIKHRMIIYDDVVFTPVDEETTQSIIEQKNPFRNLFDIDKVVYGEAITPFYTPAIKQNSQKLICNIGTGESDKKKTSNLDVSLLSPLFMRYIFINSYQTNDYERFSDLDLYSTQNGYGKYETFDYERTIQVEIKPGD